MKKVYIVLAHTGTILSRIIRIKTGAEYTHSSIALDEQLNKMYSFGRKNAYIAFIGGFVREGASFGTYKRFYNTEISIYELQVTNEQYDKIQEIIEYMKIHKDEYKFNITGMFLAGFDRRRKSEKTYYCAEFVKAVLERADIDVSNLPEVIRPEGFKELKNAKLVYKGLLKKYYKEKNNYMGYLIDLMTKKKDIA